MEPFRRRRLPSKVIPVGIDVLNLECNEKYAKNIKKGPIAESIPPSRIALRSIGATFHDALVDCRG